jgi:hypothetical protein
MRTFYLMLTSALLFLQCSEIQIKSNVEKEAISVDGLAYDWEKYPVEYNDEWHLVYGAVNNDSTLFLQFSFNDPHLARMMARRGIILWFGGSKKFGLKYAESPSLNDFKNFQPDEMYIPKGNFSAVAEDTIVAPDLDQYKPVSAKFALDKGLYCMEFCIPLNITPNLNFLNSLSSGKYQFSFQLAGLTEEEKEEIAKAREERKPRGEKGNPGGMTGGMAGGMEGGRSGRMPGGGPAHQFRDMEGKEINFEVTLSE